MPTIKGSLTVPTQTGVGPATGIVHITPYPRRQLTADESSLLPAPTMTRLVDGEFSVYMEETDAFWCYVVYEETQVPRTRYVAVRDTLTTNYHDLEEVDPRTFDPLVPIPPSAQEILNKAREVAKLAHETVNEAGEVLPTARKEIRQLTDIAIRNAIEREGAINDAVMAEVADDPASSFHASLSSTIATETAPIADASGRAAAVDELSRMPEVADAAATRAVSVSSDAAMAGNLADPASASRQHVVGKGELVVNVRDYGAAGDGTTDDTAAIQDALNAAGSLSTVRTVLLSGTSVVGPLTIPAGATLVGDGHSTLRVRPGSHTRVIHLAGAGAAIRDLHIDGNAPTQTAPSQDLIYIDAEGCQASGLYITGAHHRIFWISPAATHTAIRDCVLSSNGVVGNCNAFDIRGSYVTISGCHIYDHGNGHVFRVGNTVQEPPRHIVITDALVERAQHNAFTLEIAASYVTIANSTVYDAPQAVKGDGTAHHITVTGCTFEKIHLGTAFNMLAVEDVIVTGARLKDAAGGFLTGRRSIINGCTAENIGIGALDEPTAFYAESGIIANCIATNVTGAAARLGTGGGIIRGNLLTNIGRDATHYMVAINANESAGAIISDNILRNPTSTHPTATAFALFANRGIAKGNALDGPLPRGVRVLNGRDHYIVAHNILSSATTPILEGDGANRLIEGNI